MSLYDGLGVDNTQGKATGWSPSFQMLKTQLQARKATLTKAKNEKGRLSSSVAPVVDFTKLRQDDTSLEDMRDAKPSVFLGGEILEKFADEYDPLHPNDYDHMTKKDRERKENQQDAGRDRELEERRKRRAERHAKKGPDDELPRPMGFGDEVDFEREKKKRAYDRYAPSSYDRGYPPPPRDYDRYGPPPREYASEYDRYREYRDYPREYSRSSSDYYRREASYSDRPSSYDYPPREEYVSSSDRERSSALPPSTSERDRGYSSSHTTSHESRDTRDTRDSRDPYSRSSSSAAPEYDYSRKTEGGSNGYDYSSYMNSSSNYGPMKSSYSSRSAGPYTSSYPSAGAAPSGSSGQYSSSARY